jgi:tetratricopeptide (TPR) repeat protein
VPKGVGVRPPSPALRIFDLRFSIRDFRTIAALASLLCATELARADAVWIGPPTAAPLIKDIRITRIDSQKLYFEVAGRETSRDISKVTRLSVDNEAAFNAGEDSMAIEKYDAAVDNFQRVVRASSGVVPANKQWMIGWASRRLQEAAQKTGRFDAAVAAFIARVQIESPAGVPRPALPDEKSTYLDTAANDINTALTTNTRLSDDQRAALLGFLVDIQRGRRDPKAADQAAEKLDEILAKDPNNPNAARAIARRHLQIAQGALERKDFRQATSEIESNRAMFTDPLQQSDALFVLAEARLGAAVAPRQQSPAATLDANALKDSALAYMRIVAHFKDAPDRPHVVQALLRTAQIHELLGDRANALKLYQQIISQYADDPNTSAARQSVERLKQPTTAPSTGAPSTAPASSGASR